MARVLGIVAIVCAVGLVVGAFMAQGVSVACLIMVSFGAGTVAGPRFQIGAD